MSAVFEQGKGRWFYSLNNYARPVGPYVTLQHAMKALESATPPPPQEKPAMVEATEKPLHYTIRKIHVHAFFVVLLLGAVAVGWELNNLHHPVQMSFCAERKPADGPQL
jgi:hypothetical protein